MLNVNILSVFPINNMGDVLLASLLAILIVFSILALIILISFIASTCINKSDRKHNIMPKEENKILESDEDAVVAALVATIEFNKEFKKNARLVSIKKIDE